MVRALFAFLLACAATAQAQTVTHDVRLIVPYAPGGTVDLLGRLLADGLTQRLGGHSVVVENRSGAGTFIAMQAVANAAPDGHTLSLSSGAVLATAPIIPGTVMPIDPDRALLPVTNLIRVPILLVGRPQAPYATVPELVAYAKARPGLLNIGQSGSGSVTHLLAARFAAAAGIRMEQIQYRGGTPALLDVMTGTADLYFSLLPESLTFVREARLTPIAFASPERSPALPQVPLMQDTLPGFVGDVAYGMVLGAAAGADWVTYWNRAVNAVMDQPALRQKMRDLLWVPVNGTAAAYAQEIQDERRIWGPVIQAAGIRADGG